MIPEFPSFKKLELSDRTAVRLLTRIFPPYSDFNFTSLWSWDTKEAVRVATLNGNFVVRFTDYTTGEPFYSFLGDRNVDDTARNVLQLARSEGLTPELRLLPEVSAWRLSPGRFAMRPDEDNFDYVLSADRLKGYRGNRLGPKRNFVNRFKKRYEAATIDVDISDEGVQSQILDLFHRWTVQKGLSATNAENELIALHRLLFAVPHLTDLFCVATFIGDEMAAFSINEIVGGGYAVIHFEKADAAQYVGIYPHLMQQMAWLMAERGCRYINYEQDLGLTGLRRGKSSYIPADYLRKYTLRTMSTGASKRPTLTPPSEAVPPLFFLTAQESALRLPPLVTEAWNDALAEAEPSAEPLPSPVPPRGEVSLRLPPLKAERWLEDLQDEEKEE